MSEQSEALEASGSASRCDGCRFGGGAERYDQRYCFNQDSQECGGYVEAGFSCEKFCATKDCLVCRQPLGTSKGTVHEGCNGLYN